MVKSALKMMHSSSGSRFSAHKKHGRFSTDSRSTAAVALAIRCGMWRMITSNHSIRTGRVVDSARPFIPPASNGQDLSCRRNKSSILWTIAFCVTYIRKHKDTARQSRNQSPHPALRATFSQREKDTPTECPSPSGRECREAAGEGSKNFVEKTRSNILVTQRHKERPHPKLLMRPCFVSLCLCAFL